MIKLPKRLKAFFEPAEGTPWLLFVPDAVQRGPAITQLLLAYSFNTCQIDSELETKHFFTSPFMCLLLINFIDVSRQH